MRTKPRRYLCPEMSNPAHSPNFASISIGRKSRLQARNLGVIFDSKFSLEAHVNKVCQYAYLQQHIISQVRKCLNGAACEALIHTFISSIFDSMNAILHGLPDYLIEILQKVQNPAAQVLCGLRKYGNTTPALQAVHKLPIRKRIE